MKPALVDVLSPVAMFVYNRVDNTRSTIEFLKKNELAPETILYVFSDGGKNEESWKEVNQVRHILHTISGFKKVIIIERPENIYLERNIIEGLNHVLSLHETVIVLEDDICTSPIYLTYMNEALKKYREERKVMHVTGFTNLDIPELGDTYFTPHMSGWGWGTWKNRWQYFTHYTSREEALQGMDQETIRKIEYNGIFNCLKSLDKNPIPWDICWEITIYKHSGLCLNPTHTLIRNIGLGRGTHFNTLRLFGWFEFDRPFRTERVILKDIPVEENLTIESMYAQALKDHGMRYNWLGKIARYIYKFFFSRS